MILIVGHIDVPCSVQIYVVREIESCGAKGSVGGTGRAIARDGCYISGRCDFTNGVVGQIGDINIALIVDSETIGTIKPGGSKMRY
jgi:hypothetical protein